MDTHEVLVAARGVQERRGYDWNEGSGLAKECCPGRAIASVLGTEGFDVEHPAALVLADQFACSCGLADAYRETLPSYVLSHAVGCEERYRDAEFSLAEVLACYDRAIAATAPEPSFESLGQEPATAREPINESVFA